MKAFPLVSFTSTITIIVFVATACQSSNIERSPSSMESQLYRIAQEWIGTPYRWGGEDKRGVDCSGLVYVIFQQFGIWVPRTVEQLWRSGRAVSLRDLQPGDVLFFRLRNKISHVGLYLGNFSFIHASSSQGVIISSLYDPYYKQSLVGIRRYLGVIGNSSGG